MLRKIYQELVLIRKELQAIGRSLESSSEIVIHGTVNADKLQGGTIAGVQ